MYVYIVPRITYPNYGLAHLSLSSSLHSETESRYIVFQCNSTAGYFDCILIQFSHKFYNTQLDIISGRSEVYPKSSLWLVSCGEQWPRTKRPSSKVILMLVSCSHSLTTELSLLRLLLFSLKCFSRGIRASSLCCLAFPAGSVLFQPSEPLDKL